MTREEFTPSVIDAEDEFSAPIHLCPAAEVLAARSLNARFVGVQYWIPGREMLVFDCLDTQSTVMIDPRLGMSLAGQLAITRERFGGKAK